MPIREAARNAVRLRRFATFQRASHASLKTMQIWETPDSRRWVTPAKRERHAYGNPTPLSTVAAVEEAILALPVKAETHVIGLAAVNLGWFGLARAAADHVTAIRDAGGRVFLVGTPGRTIIRSAEFAAIRGLDFGWVTFTRDAFSDTERSTPLLASSANSEIGFYGCVIDGLDCSTAIMDGYSWSAQFTFADCVVISRNGPPSASNVSNEYMPRFHCVRSILDFANDGASIYGAGAIRFESCYFIGSGGAWRNGGFLHADLGGQYQSNNPSSSPRQHHWIALWNNVFDMGPNAFIPDSFRAAPNTFMNQSGHRKCYDVIGNIFMQPVVNQGFQRVGWRRRLAIGDAATSSWWQNAHVAYNLWLMRPDTVQPGWTYPQAQIGTLNSPEVDMDLYIGTGNLLMQLPSSLSATKSVTQSSFDRAISIFPEEATYRSVTVANGLASFPAVSGTWAGGYTLDWSGTTYAGTSREGFIAPEDCVVSASLRTWGSSPLRGLPHDADYIAANFTGLPADIRVHLGHVDALGDPMACGYGPDWFGGFAPTAGSIGATISDPWGAEAVDYAMLVNCRIGTLGTGQIIREVDAADPLKTWTLDVVQEGGSHFPRFTATDAAGAVTHQVQSARPLAANSHLLFSASLAFRPCFIESFMFSERVANLIWDHYERDGSADELSAVFETSPTAPAIPAATPGSKEMFIWLDTSAPTNLIRTWSGSEWVRPTEHWRDLATALFLEEHRVLTKNAGAEDERDRLYGVMFGPMKFRITFVPSLPHTPVHAPNPSSATQAWGDRIWAATNGSYSTGFAMRRWTGSAWIDHTFTSGDIQPEGGDKSFAFVIDGKAPARRAGAVWSNTAGANAPTGLIGSSGSFARGTVSVGSATASPYTGALAFVEARRIPALEPADIRVGPFDAAIGSVQRAFARPPVDAATGARDNPVLGAAEVWLVA